MEKIIKQDLIPLSRWNDYYDFPSVNALRQLVFYNRNNFIDTVTRRIGKRIYISVPNFFTWVDSNGQRG